MRFFHPIFTAFLLLLFTCRHQFVIAQGSAGFEFISTAQGLSQGLINDMIQDREGFIWIATKGGLNRYDGYSFKVFTTNPADSNSISSNSISTLLEDGKGRIWIGTTDGGINIYNKKTGRFTRIIHKQGSSQGLSSNRIDASMAELPDGRILVNPQGGALQVLSMNEVGKVDVIRIRFPAGETPKWIFKDEKGFIWVNSLSTRIYILDPSNLELNLLFDGNQFTGLIEQTGQYLSAKFSQSLEPMQIPDLRSPMIDSSGKLNPGVLSKGMDDELMIENRFPIKAGAYGSNVYDFSLVKKGDKLNAGFARNLKTNVKDQNIKCLLLDRSGVLWVGTMGHGLIKNRIRNYDFLTVWPNISVQRITVWNNDQIYVQGWRDSKLFTTKGEELPNPVKSVFDDGLAYINTIRTKKGDYWLYWGNHRSLFNYSSGMKMMKTFDEPVSLEGTEHLQPLLEDSKHRIWVCGANGTLANVDPSTGAIIKYSLPLQQFTGSSSLTQTNTFYEDRQGVFWLGTEHGFARLEFEENADEPAITWFKNIPGNNNSLSYNYVSWFMDDPVDSNYLWISTKGGGINRLDKTTKQFIHFTTKDGLPNDVVYGLLTDNAGNIWGSTNRGLFCMLANKGQEQPVFRIFGTEDGLQDDEFNTNAVGKLSNGNLVFGGVKGMNIFNPQQVLQRDFSPNVFITGIQIGSRQVMPGDNSGVLSETIEQSGSITLTHFQDVLTLEFSSLDFTAPLQNKYRYQLVGIDKDWVESANRRSATYLHLPAGNYVFKVQGSNSQGIWSSHIAALELKILPPWWRSWWAYSMYALLLIVIVRGWIQFNINRAKLRAQLSLEQLEAKRVKELDSVKTQLYTNITHEFRTPLTVILGMAQQVKEKPEEQFDTRMDMILRNGKNLLNLVNELLDLSKLETGKMQLQLSQAEVVGFLRYVVETFQSLANSQQKQLHFLAEIDLLHLEYDREKLRQVVSNLLSNAIKFTPEKGNIYISVNEAVTTTNAEHATLIIKVKDTGIGIPEDQLPHIFDRFYQLDNSHTRNAEGTGIGLALTRELVKLMEGEILVKSPPTGAVKGTEFTVLLPLKKVAPIVEAGDDNLPLLDVTEIKQPAVFSTADIEEHGKETAPLILLVEDNADVVAYTASCLTDYRLAIGKDGREGLEIATEIIPDLIITDVMMPFMDGFQLAGELRSNELTSHIPVIMLTAKADLKSRIEGLQMGAEAYLEKPFNKEELLVRIRKLLEMRKHLQQYYLNKAGIENRQFLEVREDVGMGHSLLMEEEKEDSFVLKVREAISENITDIHFSVEKLCKILFMSHSQLHRKLDALTGCSPNKFIRIIRLNRAKELLLNETNSIGSIALDCGYADPGYFARVFKQEFGVTPQEWRREVANVKRQT